MKQTSLENRLSHRHSCVGWLIKDEHLVVSQESCFYHLSFQILKSTEAVEVRMAVERMGRGPLMLPYCFKLRKAVVKRIS